MKPRIKICRNFRGEYIWRCVGIPLHGRHAISSAGRTPIEAFETWLEDCDFPF